MRVLYLTYDGLTDPLGQSQILPYLLGLRKRLGERFEPAIISFEKPERYTQWGDALETGLASEGIKWYPQRFHRWPPLLAKVYDHWLFKQTAWNKAKVHSYDVYHARSYVAGWIAHQISERTGQPWIFDMRGFWVDERRENGLWPLSNPLYKRLYRLWKAREQVMLKSANEIVVLTEAAQKTLEEWGIPAHKITVIPCAADFNLYALPPQERLRARQAIREKFRIPPEAVVFLYSGSVAPHYAPEDIVAILTSAYQVRKDVYLLMLTPHTPSSLLATLEYHGFPRSQYRATFAPRSEMPMYLAAADIGIATVKLTFSKTASSFTKLAEYLAADLPVIATAIGDVETHAQQIPGIFPYRHLLEIPATVQRALNFLLNGKTEQEVPLSVLSRPLLGLEMAVDRYQAIYERILSHTRQ